MKKKARKGKRVQGIILIVPILLVFCILGGVVFSIANKISNEMSASAVTNLGESLNLIQGTVEVILDKEAEFQKLMAGEIAVMDNPEEFIRSYSRNGSMVMVSMVRAGETEGFSNTGESFSAKDLDFSSGRTVEGLPVSGSYLNRLGTWAYTM